MFRIAAPAVALALLAGCQQPAEEVVVTDAWVRLPAVAANPGAAYLTIEGGADPATLVAVRAPFALRTEMHETMHHDGRMTMEPIGDVPIPARGTLAIEPGGKHVMVYDISPNVRAGTPVPLRFEFAEGREIEVEAQVVGPADPAPED